MVEVTIPSEPSHETRSHLAANPLLPGNEHDDDNIIVADNGPDAIRTVALSQTNKFSGHPCATGCGHFCWAATGIPGGKDG
jgi:hypothetical protein